jgi:hypothetical protein
LLPDRPRWQGTWGAAGFALLLALVALGGTLLLYWEALGLPFFFDDMIHLRWLDWHSLPSLWTTAEGLGYYRPLTMSVWKIDHLIFGRNDPQRLHLLSLLLHALNAAMAGLLARRAFRGPGWHAYALLTTLLFLTFPFSYQAVPSTSSLSKPLIATLVLGSTLLYWEGRRKHSRGLILVSLLVSFLAPFAYESGVMVPLAILAVEVLGTLRREFGRFSWWPFLYMLVVWGIAFPLIVLTMPETGASLGLPSLVSLWQNGIYFLEGLLFPISSVVTPLEGLLSIDQYVLLTIVVLLGVAGLLAFYFWARRLDLFLYAGSWFVVGVLPLWFALDFGYVITSPRLFYLGSVGAVLLWAGVPVLLWTRRPARWWAQALAVISTLAMLAFNVAYVRDKMALADAVARPLWGAVRAAQGYDDSASLLYLNVPAWVAPKEPTYRVGTEGLTFIPEYVRVQDFVYVNAGVEPEIRAAMFAPAKQDWSAYIGYAGPDLDWDGLANEIRQVDGVYLNTYSTKGLHFVETGGLERRDGGEEPQRLLARFGEQIWLPEYQAEIRGDQVNLTFWWYAEQVPEGDLTIFVHVYDESGQLVAQGDGYPLGGLFPPRQWQPGDRVRDRRYVALPEDLASGGYTVAVGWYDPAAGQRLPALDEQGQPIPQDAVRVLQFSRP